MCPYLMRRSFNIILGRKVTKEGIIFTDSLVAALEKKRSNDKACDEWKPLILDTLVHKMHFMLEI